MSITSPEGFYRAAGKCITPLMVLGLLLFVVGFYMGFFECPIDYKQGNSYRIIFIHVSAAWMSMLLYILMAVCSAIGLLRNSRLSFILSQAIGPDGRAPLLHRALLGRLLGPSHLGHLLGLGRPSDVGPHPLLPLSRFMALHTAIDDKRRADRAASVISIVGVINVPIIYFSVQWWNTLHQGASITTKGSSMAEIMLYTLLVMVAAGMCYGTAAVLSRARTIILERERRSDWALEAAKGGKL
mgnify:CR=1 FL=1